MSDIQRWAWDTYPNPIKHPDGAWVAWRGHVAAVAEAEQRGREMGALYEAAQYEQGQRDERLRIRKAVEGLKHSAICYCSTCEVRDEDLAVIDGEGNE